MSGRGAASRHGGTLAFDRPSIAVLPFTSDSSDDSRYFSDGVTEDIVTELSRFRELAVVFAGSSFGIDPQSSQLSKIARALDVRYVLRGSIRHAGNRVRITGQLIDPTTGNQLWADRYDGSMESLLDLQAEIAGKIAASIVGEIEWSELRQAHRLETTNAAAYDLALQAGALLAAGVAPTNVELLTEAIRLAQEAMAIDPTCRRALSVLAMAFCRRGVIEGIGDTGADDLAAADKAARWLWQLDPSDHAAYAIVGHVAMRRLRHDDAISNLRRAHELNPNDVVTLRWLSWRSPIWGWARRRGCMRNLPSGSDRATAPSISRIGPSRWPSMWWATAASAWRMRNRRSVCTGSSSAIASCMPPASPRADHWRKPAHRSPR